MISAAFSINHELQRVKKIRNLFEYLAAFLIILVLLTTISSVIVVKFYGDNVRDYAMDMLNDQLDTKITVGEIGVSIFRKFPNTSVFFNDVTVWSGHQFERGEITEISPDTLFVADRLYLQFNLLDLLRKRYTIKSLEAREGSLRILIDSNGRGNFNVTSQSDKPADSKLIQLSGVSVRDMQVVYINRAKQITVKGRLEEIRFDGNFGNESYMLKTSGDAYINLFLNHGVRYLAEQDIHTDISLEVDKNHFNISKGLVSLGDLSAEMDGEFIIDQDEGTFLDLQFSGKKIDISWVSGILASKNISPGGIRGRGNVDLSVEVNGLLTPTLTPGISARFSTRNAYLAIDQLPYPLSNLTLEGSYTNGSLMSVKTTGITLESFSVTTGSSTLAGKMNLQNLLEPVFTASLKGNIVAKELNEYAGNAPAQLRAGTLYPDLTFSGNIERISPDSVKINIRPTGSMTMENISLSFVNSNARIDQLGGDLKMTNDQISAGLDGYFMDTDFRLKIASENPFTQREDPSRAKITGSLHSSNVNIDKILENLKGDNTRKKQIRIPEQPELELEFDFDRITKGELQTRQVSGTLIYKYPGLYIEPVYLETMNGVINSKIAFLDLHRETHQLSMQSSFRNVDIGNIFKTFNNFGQDFLTYKNIAGRISGESEFLAELKDDFSIITSEIISENKLIIEDGELIDFEPMVELSEFLKIDKMDHIRFSTISNTILINDNAIRIPQMDIRSSALNLSASGVHRFDKTYEYHLATRLSEYLFNKARNSGDDEFNIALDKDDKRTIFLVLYDEGEGMLIEFDEAQVLKKIRNDIREEKTELKSLLNEEFGIFKKDSSLKENRQKESRPEFRFDFSPEQPGDTIRKEETKKRWWQRKREPDKNQKLDFVLDDDER